MKVPTVVFTVIVMAVMARAISAVVEQRMFNSPDEAMQTLVNAAKAQDRSTIDAIFGPNSTNLLTGDAALDKANFQAFSRNVAAQCRLNHESADKATLQIGQEGWTFPIPIVKTNGGWMFDTIAGEEEIINRHVGRNEYYAIGVCRSYVDAQKGYRKTIGATGTPHYASRFRSTPGQSDGLDSLATTKEFSTPLALLVRQACLEGNGKPQPFHGYVFRILTKQSASAPGGTMNYVEKGQLRQGFGLVAFPVVWGDSGVMTFIVNQDGVVHEKDLGPKTTSIASGMKEYNPDSSWKVVSDEGIPDASSEQISKPSR